MVEKNTHAHRVFSISHPSLHPTIHPFSISVSPALRVTGCWSLSQLSLGEGGVTPWTSHQFIAGSHRGKLPFAANTIAILHLQMGREERASGENPRRATEKPWVGIEPTTFLLYSDGAKHSTNQSAHLLRRP